MQLIRKFSTTLKVLYLAGSLLNTAVDAYNLRITPGTTELGRRASQVFDNTKEELIVQYAAHA